MKIEIDKDLILPFIVAVSAIVIPYLYSSTMLVSTHQKSVKELKMNYEKAKEDLEKTSKALDALNVELQSYKVTEQSLMELGASPLEAKRAMMASEVYGLDPKPLGAL
jgi:hypothetical protein